MGKTLLTLDVATTTGFAWGELGAIPKAGAITFTKKGVEPIDDDVWLAALRWLHPLLGTIQPDVVALEAPIMSSAPAGGSNPHTQLRLSGLQAVMRTVIASALPSPARLVSVQTVRKYFIGQGNLKGDIAKKLVKARCIELGWLEPGLTGYDRSDAQAVWAKVAGDLGDHSGAFDRPAPKRQLQLEPNMGF